MLASGPPLELNTGSFFSHAFDGAVYVSESSSFCFCCCWSRVLF
jgi:hypothetical protein